MVNSKKKMTEIEQLTKKFENEGVISTYIQTGDMYHTTTRLHQLVEMKGVDSIVVSDNDMAIVLDKEEAADIVHKIYYMMSLMQSDKITLAKSGKEAIPTTKKVCHFDDFSERKAMVGLGYHTRTRQRS